MCVATTTGVWVVVGGRGSDVGDGGSGGGRRGGDGGIEGILLEVLAVGFGVMMTVLVLAVGLLLLLSFCCSDLAQALVDMLPRRGHGLLCFHTYVCM
jgi:hypothetical protein